MAEKDKDTFFQICLMKATLNDCTSSFVPSHMRPLCLLPACPLVDSGEPQKLRPSLRELSHREIAAGEVEEIPQGSPKKAESLHGCLIEISEGSWGARAVRGENPKHLPSFTRQKVRENPIYESPCRDISEPSKCFTQAAMQAPPSTEEPICCSCSPAVRLCGQGDSRVGTMLLSACLQVGRGTRAWLWGPAQIHQTPRSPHSRVKPEMATSISSHLEGTRK